MVFLVQEKVHNPPDVHIWVFVLFSQPIGVHSLSFPSGHYRLANNYVEAGRV